MWWKWQKLQMGRKHCGKRRNCLLWAISPFPAMFFKTPVPSLSGSMVSVSDSWPGSCDFDPRLRRTFFLAYFRLSCLQKQLWEVVGSFGKKSCVSTGVRKPGNTCVTDHHDITLAVTVALNPNTNNQPKHLYCRHVKTRACLGKG